VPTRTLRERCLPIEMLILDVDGVLTEGGIIYTNENVELKQYHVRDGSGLVAWHKAGKQTAILTGRTSTIVEIRARELGIHLVIQGATNKFTAYDELLVSRSLLAEKVCYVGDDLPDVPILRHCGIGVAVADACPEAVASAAYVTCTAGGQGAVRETIELILRCQGRWKDT
jgi:YrbI family 3-deoxy-D-manno-octulosonate 8-phosphate phosphatase